MATILRVKRRNSDEPQDALIICKRPKLADDSDDEAACSDLIPTVAKFAGTLEDPEENVLQHLARNLNKEEIKNSFKKPPCVNFLAQRREQTKDISAGNRYKVVNYHRSLDTSNIEEFEDKPMTFVDIEDSASLTANQDTAATAEGEKNSNCVYDLYYAENYDSIDDCVSICPFIEHELVYDMSTEDDPQSDHDSNDSNAESYYQNSYPNTDNSDDNSVDDYDIKSTIRDMKDCNFSSEDDYEDKENEVYSLDMNDVEMHGYKYARYKQRMKPLLYGDVDMDADGRNTDTSNSDSDEELEKINRSLVYDDTI